MSTGILVGPADALSAPEVAWSLIDAGFDVTAFTARGSKPPLRKAHGVRIAEVTDPRSDTAGGLRDLQEIIEQRDYEIFLPLDDYSLWLCGPLRLACPTLKLPVGPRQLEFTLNKWIQINYACSAGLLTPKTKYCRSAREALDNQWFPCFVKGALAVASENNRLLRDPSFVCADRPELERVVDNWNFSRPLLIQPRLSGIGEGIFGFASMTEVSCWSAHRRIRMMNPQGSGSSACEAILPDEGLLPPIIKMLRSNLWRGMFMAEFLRDDAGKAWFMEINGRAWGSMALARREGFEYPAWTIKSLLDQTFQPEAPSPRFPLRCRHLGREILHLIFVLKGPRSNGVANWPSFWGTINDLFFDWRRSDQWYNKRKGQFSLFWSDTWMTVLKPFLNKKS